MIDLSNLLQRCDHIAAEAGRACSCSKNVLTAGR